MKSYTYYKWRTWGLLAITFILSLFQRGAMGVISVPLSQDLSASASQIGSLASITFYTYAIMQIPAGILLDYMGYKKASVIGLFTTAIGSCLLGIAPNLALAYLARFLVGVGTSFLFIAALRAQTIWFAPKDFTKASGYLAFMGNVGGLLSTFPLAMMMGAMGWRLSMISMALLSVLVGLLVLLFTKTSPTDYGLEPLGKVHIAKKLPFKTTLTALLKLPALWRNFFCLFSLVGVTTALSGVWGIQYIETVYQVSSETSSFLISFILFGLIVGSLGVNHVVHFFNSDFVKLQRLACLLMMSSILYLLMLGQLMPSLIGLTIGLFIMGFTAIFHIVSFTDIMHHCEGHLLGMGTSVVNAGEFIGSSVISLVIGFTLDLTSQTSGHVYTTSQFNFAFIIFFVVACIGFGATFIGVKSCVSSDVSVSKQTLVKKS